ncbi:MAG: penicillin-binding protein 1C [Gammaproteobacteria bacterium]|nr:penicillin-binding protein 1C [Gammaproteobacteria bacterium]
MSLHSQRGGSKKSIMLPPRYQRLYVRLKKSITITLCLGVIAYSTLLILDVLYPPNLSRYYDTSMIITDRDGEWLRVYLSNDDKRRIATSSQELSDDYRNLLINYEDKDFYQHNGIDISAIFRAVGQNISAGRTISGASTLSMQTAKLLDPQPRTLKHKVIEAFRAWQLERRYSKSAILDIYTTLAPAGGNIEGLKAAAYYYLNKPIDKLSLSESAWLVALPQSPHRLSKNKKAAIIARNKVLKRAFTNAVINVTDYQKALAEPLVISKTPFPLLAPHISNKTLWRFKKEHKNATPTLHSEKNTTKEERHYELMTTIDKRLQRGLERTLFSQLPQQHANANLAAGILDNADGKWRAYAGTAAFFDSKRQGQVDMLAATRSPGSTLKPFISLFAFDWLNYQPQTTIDDTPIHAAYQPSNYDGTFQGRITLGEALLRSRNVPAVRLLQTIRPDYFAQSLMQHHLRLQFPKGAKPNLSLALGGVGICGNELAQLYRKLANCTYLEKNSSIHASQKPLAEQKNCQRISHILYQSQDKQGRVFFGKEPVAFKTGTAYGWRDRWIFAYTKDYTIVIWNGRADGQFAEQRASAETLIPVLRDIVSLLPHPPRISPVSSIHEIANENLPPRLRHVGNNTSRKKGDTSNILTSVIPTAQNNPNQLSIIAPLSHSVIDYNKGMKLNFRVQGGTPPYLYIVNDDIVTQSPDTNQNYQNPIAGNYHLVVIDATGNSVESHFRLQQKTTNSTKNKRAVWQ